MAASSALAVRWDSTQKLHARGPMGLGELCSYKYIIHGNGQTR